MNRHGLFIFALLALGLAARAAAQRVPFEARDLFVSGPTTLLHAGSHGEVKEIWSGFTKESRRGSPLFVEFSGRAEIERNGTWLDLTTVCYRSAGTRPGFIRLQSEDGFVSLEATARKDAAASPIFLIYSFAKPVNFRYRVRWKTPQTVRLLRSDDTAGCNTFSVQWRNDNVQPTTERGVNLVLATLPPGVTEPGKENGLARRVDSAREIVVCIDATGERSGVGGSYVTAWKNRLGGFREDEQERASSRVGLTSDEPRLDRMFSDSIDAVLAAQFANGVLTADVFYYRAAWMRDGGYSILGLALAGDFAATDAFFGYWTSQPGFPWVNGELEGQQAGTALLAIWYYSRLRPDGDRFLAEHWSYVSRMARYLEKRVGVEGMLDVAEEWICCIPSKSTWPNAEVYAGLMAGAKIAARLGHRDEAQAWQKAAQRLKERIAATGYDAQLKRFIPMAGAAGAVYRHPQFPQIKGRNGPLRDGRVDSGMLNLARLEIFGKGMGAVAVDDARFAATQAAIAEELETPEHWIGRFGRWPTSPHNPQGDFHQWPIIQAWAAQTEWLRGQTDRAWGYLLPVCKRKDCDPAVWNDYLPEAWTPQGDPGHNPFLVWSHGEFLTSVMLLTLGLDLEPAGADLGLAPSLPPQVKHARVENFRFRDWRLDFDLQRSGEGCIDVKVKPRFFGRGQATLRIALPGQKTLLFRAGETRSFSVFPEQYEDAFHRAVRQR